MKPLTYFFESLELDKSCYLLTSGFSSIVLSNTTESLLNTVLNLFKHHNNPYNFISYMVADIRINNLQT